MGLIGALLGGCAGDVNLLPALEQDTVVEPAKGIVVARFVNTGNFPLPFNQLTITPQNVNESAAIKPARLTAITKQLDGSAVFASAVDAGSYALSSIRSFHVLGERYYSRFVSADASFGTFQVRPGQVTDLGTLVYYPKPSGDKFQDVLVRVPETATGEALSVYLPSRPYEQGNLLTWDEDGFEEDRLGTFLSILQNPVTFEATYETPDGSILFLAPMGVIVERDASGNWSTDAVETNLQMFAAAQNEAGDRAVGGSEGKVFFKPAGGAWQDISLSTDQHVDGLEFAPDGRLMALVRETTAIVIRAWVPGGAWDDVNQFVATRGWYKENSSERYESRRSERAKRMAAAQFSQFEGKRFVELSMQSVDAHPLMGSRKELAFQYDPDTYVMTGVENPKDVLYQADAGALKIAVKEPGFFSWSGQPRYFRSDATEGWVEMSTYVRFCNGVATTQLRCGDSYKSPPSKRQDFRFLSVPWFRNENEAVAVASVGAPGGLFTQSPSEVKLLTTSDGGKSWTISDHELPQPYCASLVPEVDDRMLISCRGANGDFYESFDNGSSWTQVREHQNF